MEMLDGARTDLLLAQHLDRLFHVCHPLHHLDLEQLVLVDTCSQLISSLSIFSSLPLHLRQSRSQIAWMSALDEHEDEEAMIPCPRPLT